MSQDNVFSPRVSTGLMDLATEVRLMIFEQVLQNVDENAISHPLLHVCRTTRAEYITAFSGKISLYMTSWCTPFEDQKPKPTFIIRRISDTKCVLPGRFNPGYGLTPSGIPDVDTTLTPRWPREDFEAFAKCLFSWCIAHLKKIFFDPFVLKHFKNSFESLITFEVQRKDRLIPIALTTSHILYSYEDIRPLDREIMMLAEARIAQWKSLADGQDDQRRLATFSHGYISDFMEAISDKDSVGDLITAVYGSRHGYPPSVAHMWRTSSAFLETWLYC